MTDPTNFNSGFSLKFQHNTCKHRGIGIFKKNTIWPQLLKHDKNDKMA